MKCGQLHVHTKASDGDIHPDMIVRAGLSFIAVTDHDALDGVEEFRSLEARKIEIIAGVEVTVVFQGQRLHILILEPEYHPGFLECLNLLQHQRRQRIERVIDVIENTGIRLTRLDRHTRKIPTKWDITDAAIADPANREILTQAGITTPETFRRHFFDKGVADFKIKGLPAEDVLSLVQGIFIVAHPAKSLHLPQQLPVLTAFIRRFSVVGMEVSTRKHTLPQQRLCSQIANEFGMIPVVSNDVHTEAHLQRHQTPLSQWEMLRNTR